MRPLLVALLILIMPSFNTLSYDDDRWCDRHERRCHDHRHKDHDDDNSDYDAILLGVSSITVLTVAIVILTDGHTNNNSHKDKKIIKSQPNAATYISSSGKVNYVYLEQAFIIIRKEYPNPSDIVLAKARLY